MAKGFFGRLAYQRYPAEFLRSISKAGLTEDSKILDVGCGSGSLLYTLKQTGFKNCLGVDKYIPEDIQYENGLKIQKSVIQDVDGQWDIIIFNHSLEHMFDQLQTMQAVSKLLAENGVCLINLPIASNYAWKKYRTNWFHLDAPRHFFLHSVKSLEILAEKANLVLRELVYNSTASSILRSEQYIKGIPLCSQPSNSIFSRGQIKSFELKAEELNLKNRVTQRYSI